MIFVPHNFYLAPLRGVTDVIFRETFERYFGHFDFLLTPFITSVRGREVKASHLNDVSGEVNDRRRVVPQMLGNEIDMLRMLAETFVRLGYSYVNLNLGCPHPQVTKKKRGSGLLPHPGLVEPMIASLCGIGTFSLSVKVRLGLEKNDDLIALMPVLNRYPLSEVIIHPRTASQGYTGSVDFERFAEAAAACCHPVVYNGDITTSDFFADVKHRFPGIARWMVGRGIVERPGLLDVLRNGEADTPDAGRLRRFHDDLFSANEKRLFGPSHLLGKMKEFWAYFCISFPKSAKVFRQISRCSTVAEYHARVNEAFSKIV